MSMLNTNPSLASDGHCACHLLITCHQSELTDGGWLYISVLCASQREADAFPRLLHWGSLLY